MGKCHVCGNSYDKSFEVLFEGQKYTFDSFECAIQELAPICKHCKCKIIGHGVEDSGVYYCCAHCAKVSGATGIKDRV